jgi:hypothetical protein
MMEVMMQNPAMQQLLLARLPPHMQRPEVLRAMMANPEVRARIAAIAQQSVSNTCHHGMVLCAAISASAFGTIKHAFCS